MLENETFCNQGDIMEVERLCHLFEDLLDPGLIERLGLDREAYKPAFERVRAYWIQVLPFNGQRYAICAVRQLTDVSKTPQEFEDISHYLADSTAQVYVFGSDQFLDDAVPALVDCKLVERTTSGLKEGIDVLLETINSISPDGRRYRGEIDFTIAAARMRSGELRTLDDIKKAWPPLG